MKGHSKWSKCIISLVWRTQWGTFEWRECFLSVLPVFPLLLQSQQMSTVTWVDISLRLLSGCAAAFSVARTFAYSLGVTVSGVSSVSYQLQRLSSWSLWPYTSLEHCRTPSWQSDKEKVLAAFVWLGGSNVLSREPQELYLIYWDWDTATKADHPVLLGFFVSLSLK